MNHYENNPEVRERMTVTAGDIDALKEAFKYGVTNLNSASKIGSENVLFLFITLPENSLAQLPIMKNLVNISKEADKTVIDLNTLAGLLERYQLENIELFFNEKLLQVLYPGENQKWQTGRL
jgi:CRISPR-associated protein Csh2